MLSLGTLALSAKFSSSSSSSCLAANPLHLFIFLHYHPPIATSSWLEQLLRLAIDISYLESKDWSFPFKVLLFYSFLPFFHCVLGFIFVAGVSAAKSEEKPWINMISIPKVHFIHRWRNLGFSRGI
ncbi:unnamed protein product [Victoria cruziana]